MSRVKKPLLFTLIGVVLACCAAPTYFRARPPIHCDLPNRDYVYKAFSPPVTATSLIAVPFEVIPTVAVSPPTAAATPMVSVPPSAVVFQFSDPPLTIHHCSISNIAVQLDKNGRCVVSLQANQNPLTISLLQATPAVTTKEPLTKYTAMLQRNQFYVRLLFYGLSDGPEPATALGKPVVAQFDVPPFWVERGQPYPLRYECVICGLKPCMNPGFETRYLLIDRVEIEFKYRLAHYEKAVLP